LINPSNSVATIAIGLVGAPGELVAAVSSALSGVKGCELINLARAAHVSDFVLGHERLGLLIVFAGDATTRSAVRDLVQLAESRRPAVPVVVLAESALAGHAAEFLVWGVADCLFRPVNLSRLTFLIDFLTLRRRAFGPQPATQIVPPLAIAGNQVDHGLVFASEASLQLRTVVARLGEVDTSLLLHGESGSGKTCVARLIHELSHRKNKPFVVVNCGSLPETLLEGELFGYRQGAYTGANRNHRGKFAQAEDGTLFLDEIDSLSLAAQSKLLRVVEERSFEALGSELTEKVRARLVFATNRDLAHEVEAGRFRQDLYYRLNVISIGLPSLRSRTSDIPLLVEEFLRDVSAKGTTPVKRFSTAALALMGKYSWPGNLRELRNTVERVAVLCERDVANVEDLPGEIQAAVAAGAGTETSSETTAVPIAGANQLALVRRTAEREEIVRTLAQCRQNRSRAAESLGISRTAFYKKLRQFGIAGVN
jgi:DNA-binding NtrC family response regulator